MASTTVTPTNSSDNKVIVTEIPSYIRVFNDGTVERTWESPFVPPMLLDDPQTGISSKDVVITQNPQVSARIYLPKLNKSSDQDRFPILVYFHGGGFFLGSAFCQLFHTYLNHFVPQANAIVVSVEYRLAPETPLPACYNDCWEALKWVASHRDATNNTNTEPWLIDHGDFDRVFIGGDSAGGNITHNIAMRAGSEALPCGVKVVGAILGHPFFYSSKPIGSEHVKVKVPEEDIALLMWNLVYPCAPGGIDNPMANPVDEGAPSLAGLGCSKMLVCVAGKDHLRDRGVWYYDAVKNSGWKGDIELFEEKEEDHIYHASQPDTENAHKLFKIMADFLHQ